MKMKTLILDGRIVRDHIAATLQKEVATLSVIPGVAIIQVGDLPESTAFIKQKKLFGEKIGVKVIHHLFKNSITEEELFAKIAVLNKDKTVHGIIVQLPLPVHINKDSIIEALNPAKDVDGLHSVNVKKLWVNDKTGMAPATARGVMTLCRFYNIDPAGKKVVIVGRSTLVGKPLAHLFLNANSTVTIAHSKTKHLSELTQQADILIVAAGVPKFIGTKHIKKSQIVIDVGITSKEIKMKSGELKKILVGDVNFDAVCPLVKAITPVPGGVGPLTVASLFQNVVEVAQKMLN